MTTTATSNSSNTGIIDWSNERTVLDVQLEFALQRVKARRSALADLARDRMDIEAYATKFVGKSDVQRGLEFEWQEACDLYEAAHVDVDLLIAKIAAFDGVIS